MRLLLLLLAVSDVALAMAVFVLLARPERTLAAFAAVAGLGEAWRHGELDQGTEQQLLLLARRAQLPALAALFGWSFLVGALVTWARL